MPRCAICFGEHETKKHNRKASREARSREAVMKYRCPKCFALLDKKTLQEHAKKGCAFVIGTPQTLRDTNGNNDNKPD